jgi:hypothetical protein
LRGVLKDLETDKAVAVNEEVKEEYLVDARNRVDFTDIKHGINWGLCQLYCEWDMEPLAIWEKRTVVPESLRTWYFSKSMNKWVQSATVPEGAAKIVLSQTEYYIQRKSMEAADRAMYEQVKNNSRSRWMWVFATVIIGLILMLVVGQFTQLVNAGKATNPFTAFTNTVSSVTSGGKK